MSSHGTPGETGILVLDVPAGSALAAAGLQKDDVKAGDEIKIGIVRTQKPLTLTAKIN